MSITNFLQFIIQFLYAVNELHKLNLYHLNLSFDILMLAEFSNQIGGKTNCGHDPGCGCNLGRIQLSDFRYAHTDTDYVNEFHEIGPCYCSDGSTIERMIGQIEFTDKLDKSIMHAFEEYKRQLMKKIHHFDHAGDPKIKSILKCK